MPSSFARVARLALTCALLSTAAPADAATWFVVPGGTGNGSAAFPFGRIQDAIAAAQPGDVITVADGVYAEALTTARPGTASAPITLRGATPRGAIITRPGRVLTVSHPYFAVTDLVLDGQYGASDLVRVDAAGRGFVLRGSELRRTSKDALDIGAADDVTVEGSLIHHALNAAGGRTDAHGIVAGAVRRLTVRDTEIHTFSGDGIQVDPGRSAPGWDDVRIEGCRIWLAPLPAAANGFAAGVVPGENALDTKAGAGLPRARITVVDTEASGFGGGLISNMAAFNIKENVDAVLDRVTVSGSEIAFRLRGPGSGVAGAWVRVQNAVVHATAVAFRYEDDIEQLQVWNTTIGLGVGRPFVRAAAAAASLDVRNLLIAGTSLPVEASDPSNLAVPVTAFVDAAAGDYQLAPGSPAVDGGVSIPGVTGDRLGTARPIGLAPDVGAYEQVQGGPPQGPPPGEIVIYAARASALVGNWKLVADTAAAGGVRATSADRGVPAIPSPLASPTHYFEVQVQAEAGQPYRLWLRGKAKKNKVTNDSVYVQFTGSVTATGAPLYRVGSTAAALVAFEPCSGCGLAGWGWQPDTATGGTAGLIRFASPGIHTVRIQIREDGVSIDQIVLSPAAYLTAAPGAARSDSTVLPEGS